MAPSWRRGKYLILAAQLALFAILVLCYFRGRAIYDAYLAIMGGIPADGPFTDLNYVFAALRCVRHGLNPYFEPSCMPRGQYYVYPPGLLLAAVFPVSDASTMPTGIALDLVFFLSLLLLPDTRSRFDFVLRLLAGVSSMVAYAAVSANIDVVLFLATIVAVSLIVLSDHRRFWAYPVIAAAAAAKLYPAILFIIAIRERLRTWLAIGAIAIVLAAVYIVSFHGVLAQMTRHLPTGPYLMNWFGAVNLPYGITEIARGLAPGAMVGVTAAVLPIAIEVLLVVITIVQVARLIASPRLITSFAGLAERDKILLVAGGLIIVGCFFAWQNLGYRGIYLLLVLPGLAALAERGNADGRWRLPIVTAILIVFLMWTESIRHGLFQLDQSIGAPVALRFIIEIGFWLLKEVIWWRVIAVLTAFLVCFVLEAGSMRILFGRAARS